MLTRYKTKNKNKSFLKCLQFYYFCFLLRMRSMHKIQKKIFANQVMAYKPSKTVMVFTYASEANHFIGDVQPNICLIEQQKYVRFMKLEGHKSQVVSN